jgi:hypothetical protein
MVGIMPAIFLGGGKITDLNRVGYHSQIFEFLKDSVLHQTHHIF